MKGSRQKTCGRNENEQSRRNAVRSSSISVYSFGLRETIINAICACFWYKRGLRSFLIECGVPERYYDAKAVGSKGQFIPIIINDLATRGEDGKKVLDTICRELVALDGPVDKGELNEETARSELLKLRQQMRRTGLTEGLSKQEGQSEAERNQAAKQAELARRLAAVRDRFYELHRWQGTPQERGVQLQSLLKDLFAAHEIPYDPPFRTPGQEMDGKFVFASRHFLVEARWRKDEADFQALSHFHSKIKTKLTGTLGLFISMEGFQPDAVQSVLQLGDRSMLLLSGMELVKIIEEHISLPDALDHMISEASKRGSIVVTLPT